jgi:hypothetical protein
MTLIIKIIHIFNPLAEDFLKFIPVFWMAYNRSLVFRKLSCLTLVFCALFTLNVSARVLCEDSFQIAPFNYELHAKALNPVYLTPIQAHPSSYLFKKIAVHKLNVGGGVNNGLYTYSQKGMSKIIKTFPVMDPHSDRFYLQRSFLEGALLGSLVGGPKIYDFGFIKMPNGLVNFYIEMERLFPEQNFYTTKNYPKDSEVWNFETRKQVMYQVADLYLRALERGILVEDVDIAISISGQVRWIDCDFWKLQDNTYFDFDPKGNLKSVTRWMPRSEIRYFMDYFREQLTLSKALTQEFKTDFLSRL